MGIKVAFLEENKKMQDYNVKCIKYLVSSTKYNVPSKLSFESEHESPLLPSSSGVRHSTLKKVSSS